MRRARGERRWICGLSREESSASVEDEEKQGNHGDRLEELNKVAQLYRSRFEADSLCHIVEASCFTERVNIVHNEHRDLARALVMMTACF